MYDTPPQTQVAQAVPSAKLNRDVLTAAKGGSIALAGNLLQQGSRVITGILLARLLGVTQLGFYSLALNGATIAAGFALLGLRSAMVRYVARFLAQDDEAGVWGTLQVGLGFSALASLLMVAVLYLLADPIAAQVFHEPRLARLLRLICFAVPFATINEILAAVTRGFKTMRYTVIGLNIVQPVVKLVLVGCLAFIGPNPARALAAFGISTAVATLMLFHYLHRLFPLNRSVAEGRRETKQILRFSLPVYFSDLIDTFWSNLQTVLLGTLNTIAAIGMFAVATQVNLMGRLFHQSIVTISMPIVSDLYTRGDRQTLKRFYQTMSKWTFGANLPFFLILQLFPATILSIFGRGFVGGTQALSILSWANLVNTGTGICGVLLDMSGNTRLKLVNSGITTFLTISLNLLLIPRWGLLGAAGASLAAVASVNLLRLAEVYVLFRMLPYEASFAKPIAAGLATLGVGWVIQHYLAADSSLVLVAACMLLLLVVYAGVNLLLGLSPEEKRVLAGAGQRFSTAWSRLSPR